MVEAAGRWWHSPAVQGRCGAASRCSVKAAGSAGGAGTGQVVRILGYRYRPCPPSRQGEARCGRQVSARVWAMQAGPPAQRVRREKTANERGSGARDRLFRDRICRRRPNVQPYNAAVVYTISPFSSLPFLLSPPSLIKSKDICLSRHAKSTVRQELRFAMMFMIVSLSFEQWGSAGGTASAARARVRRSDDRLTIIYEQTVAARG